LYLGEVAEPRVAGFLEHHNLYGHLGVTIAGLVGLMVGGYSRIFAWLSGLTVVWISGTRGALFGMMLLIIYWWFSLPKWPRLWIAALVALLMIFGTEDRLGRFATVFDINYGTTQWRIELAQFAIAEWRKYPFAGIGINRFSTLPEAHDRFIAGHPHSLPVALLVETGLIGCVAFCLLWGFIVWRLVHIRNWKALAVLGTVFLLNLTDYSFFNTVVYIPLWVVVAWGISNGGSVSVRMTQ
jgi:O-antigen ligase